MIESGKKCYELSRHEKPLGFVERLLLENDWFSSKCSFLWKIKNMSKGAIVFHLIPSVDGIDEAEYGLLPTPSSQEPGWKNIEVVDKDGNAPEHWNQRFYHKETGRLVQKGLTQIVKMFPTPRACDGIVRHSQRWMEKRIKENRDVDLTTAVKMWPTPNARDWRSAKRVDSDTNFSQLNNVVWKTEGKMSGSLNPNWVEWLMGFPVGWTKIEKDKKQCLQ